MNTDIVQAEPENTGSDLPFRQTLLRARLLESFRITEDMKIDSLSDEIFNIPQQVTVGNEIVKFTNDWNAKVGDYLVRENGKISLVAEDRYKGVFTDISSQYGQFNIAVSDDEKRILSWLQLTRGDTVEIMRLEKTGIGNDATWDVFNCIELHARSLQQANMFHAMIDITIRKAKDLDPEGWDRI